MCEKVVVDFHAMLGECLCEMVGWTDEEVITNHVTYHLLVEVAVTHVLPIRVLEHKKLHVSINIRRLIHVINSNLEKYVVELIVTFFLINTRYSRKITLK